MSLNLNYPGFSNLSKMAKYSLQKLVKLTKSELDEVFLYIQQQRDDYAPVVVKKENPFTNLDIIAFVEANYALEQTKKPYIRALSTEPFTSEQLKNPEFFKKLTERKNAKKLFSPFKRFLTETNRSEEFALIMEGATASVTAERFKEEIIRTQKTIEKPLAITVDKLKLALKEFASIYLSGKPNTVFRNLKPKDYEDCAIIIGIYSIYGLRDDLGNVRIDPSKEEIKNNQDLNYLDTKAKMLTLNSYKTSDIYKTAQFPLDDVNWAIIAESLRRSSRKMLLVVHNKYKRGSDLVAKIMLKLFDKKVTINDIRQAHVTHSSGLSAEERIAKAKQMMHTPTEGLNTYMRNASVKRS